jgi:hypothetical protein
MARPAECRVVENDRRVSGALDHGCDAHASECCVANWTIPSHLPETKQARFGKQSGFTVFASFDVQANFILKA